MGGCYSFRRSSAQFHSVGVHTSSAVVARVGGVEKSVAAPQARASARSRACTALGTKYWSETRLALASPLIFCLVTVASSPHFKIAAGSRTLPRTTATPAAYCIQLFWPQFAPVVKLPPANLFDD